MVKYFSLRTLEVWFAAAWCSVRRMKSFRKIQKSTSRTCSFLETLYLFNSLLRQTAFLLIPQPLARRSSQNLF
ncbi:hypothetical protein QWC_31716 [Achromobacter marplatensis]|nr:hypothetical protein QWC_31716 [Achromobacter marplatensis]